jgi:NAD(P)-dependent dehydrogenase (short-subunit alcohol dehydrogenase family)
MGRLADRIALVTGGTSGIGRASAERIAREGGRVIVVARNVEAGEAIAGRLGNGSRFMAVDLADRAALHGVFDRIGHEVGGLDIAVNSAGIEGVSFTTIDEYPEETWDAVINLNLTSVWLCMKRELALMRPAGSGVIVNVASLAGLRASLSGGCGYTASKHGVIGLTRSAALECAGSGIRINAVCPGIVRTPMAVEVLGDELETASADVHPMERICEPEEVAATVAWLCSEDSSFVTGAAIPVDGGVSAG